ncbi:MAG: hypothetical protein [Bacteriophage sp.]|nr:MAG: hypothetical protein [Bacteriophage sp.]
MENNKKHYIIDSLDKTKNVFKLAYLFATQLATNEAVEVIVRPAKAKRTLEQNSKMWAMLNDLSNQKQWVVNGLLQKITPTDWKDLLTACLRQEMRVAEGINGGVVLLGRRTSRMTVKEMSDLIELMHSFGAENGIKWTAREYDFIYWSEAA